MLTPDSNWLWKLIHFIRFSESSVDHKAPFKSNSINHSFGLPDPRTSGEFYLRTLIDILYESLSDESLQRLRNIENRNIIGQPITVKKHNDEVCLDYLQSLSEFEFLAESFSLNNIDRIVEVGPGYGRTCHAILSNCEVEEYTIVDLAKGINLCRSYLAEVLSDREYSKIQFVESRNIANIKGQKFDLCINIDGFGEMNRETAIFYLSFIDQYCDNFFTKNAVCNPILSDRSRTKLFWWSKAMDLIMGARSRQIIWEKCLDRLTNPMLPDVIDVFDGSLVEANIGKFVEAYCPGSEWRCVGKSLGLPWTYYVQASYTRSN